MATERQKEANRANSQKSTGPKTEAGKAKSSLNHLSHGFTSTNIFISGEDKEEFNALLSDLIGEFQPATPNEQILVEKMVSNHWNSLRAIRLQSVILRGPVALGYIHKDLALLLRYQTTADRAYHKAHAELLKAQKERKNAEIGFESKPAPQPAQPIAAEPAAMPAPHQSQPNPAPEIAEDTQNFIKQAA
jgi:hypothetical protein